MTVIAAALTREGIVMAADSLISDGASKHEMSSTKVYVRHAYLVGYAGTLRPAQVVQAWTEWPWPPSADEDASEWAVLNLVPRMKRAAKAHDALDQNEIEAEHLVAWDDRLLCIGGDFSVLEAPADRFAIGSGSAEALGFLGDSGTWTRKDVIEAVRRSSLTASGVGGPIVVASTRGLTIEDA